MMSYLDDLQPFNVDTEKLSIALSEWARIMSITIQEAYRTMAAAILNSGLLEITSQYISNIYRLNCKGRAIIRAERRRKRADFISRGKHGLKRPRGRRKS